MLNAHYRSPLNFSRDLIEAAKNSLTRIITSVEQLEFLLKSNALTSEEITDSESSILQEADLLQRKIEDAI